MNKEKGLPQSWVRYLSGSLEPCAWTWIEQHRDCEGRPITFGHRVFSEAPPFDMNKASSLEALYSYDQLIYALSTVYTDSGESEEKK